MILSSPVSPVSTVRRATAADVAHVAAVLGRAFFDDPVFRWITPDDARRRRITPAFFDLSISAFVVLDEVYVDADEVGAVAWAPPGRVAVDDSDADAFGQRVEQVFGDDAARTFEIVTLLEDHHPEGPAHYYLQWAGVMPERQGEGIGSSLLQPVLQRCDRDRVPAYTEATSLRNRRLYERHGFRFLDEVAPAGGRRCTACGANLSSDDAGVRAMSALIRPVGERTRRARRPPTGRRPRTVARCAGWSDRSVRVSWHEQAQVSGGAVRRSATTRVVRPRALVAALLTAALLLLGASVALAQDTALRGKLRTGDRVLVAAGEVVEGDLYASGREVRVDGTVNGDLLATAAQVVVSGEVTGDVMAAAGTIDLSGRIGGDARVAGGQIGVRGPIAEDLFVAGGQVTVATTGEVGEDLAFGVGTMTVDGPVAGDILGSAGAYSRQGTVGGTETVTINEPEPRQPTAADRSLGALRRVVSILLIAALVLWLVPRAVEAPVGTLRRQPLLSLVIGLAGLVGVVVLVIALVLSAVLLAVLFGSLGLGSLVGAVVFALITLLIALGFALFLVLAFGAPVVVGATLGDLVLPQDVSGRRWWSVIGGIVLVVLVASIPVIGGFVGFLVAVFGLGALLLSLPFVRRSRDVEPTQEPV